MNNYMSKQPLPMQQICTLKNWDRPFISRTTWYRCKHIWLTLFWNLVWLWRCYLCNVSFVGKPGGENPSPGLQSVGIQSFPSPRLVAIPRLEPSLPNYSLITKGRIVGFMLFPRVLALFEYKQPRLWFELGHPCPFPTIITITPCAHPV